MRIQPSVLFCVTLSALLIGWQLPAKGIIAASENFDSVANWGTLPLPSAGGFTNFASNATGWVITNNVQIVADGAAPSQPYACRLQGTYTNYILSPRLSNGVGLVMFSARLPAAVVNQVFIDTSSGDGNWTMVGNTNTLPSTTWVSFTNSILSSSNVYLRLRKLVNTNSSYGVYFDNIVITFPPARITIATPTLNPAAPVANSPIA
jgi:hypothetical protein